MKGHRVAPVTVKLGTVLDCTIAHGDKRLFVTEWRGFQLLTGEDAMNQLRPRLYLVRGRLGADPGIDPDRANATYRRWHDRDPERVGELETADRVTILLGRMIRLGYRSDKWDRRGRTVDYDHDFQEGRGVAPLVYVDKPNVRSVGTVIVIGGSMRVTERGIA